MAREGFLATARRDPWWIESVFTWVVLSGFIIWAIFRAFEGDYYVSGPYLSPFAPLYPYIGETRFLSVAMLTMWVPAGFRLTCYFCRRVYYRAYFMDPPACAVGEPKRNYKGESAFPYILQNIHRYFLYLIIPILALHWVDTIHAFFGWEGGFGVGLGSVLLLIDTIFATLYVFSCHALRHAVGGGLDTFAYAPVRFRLWKFVSKLNEKHGLWFWISLITFGIVDIYIRALAKGIIQDIRII